VHAARQRLSAAITPIGSRERLALRSTLARVLAEDVVSPIDVPSHTNSAMDGYALRCADLTRGGTTVLDCVGTALAGGPYTGTAGPGQCVRIMTGAPLPAGTDTVVMQEQVTREGDRVQIDGEHRLGQNVRRAGEDLARGEAVLEAGRRLTAADLGLLGSLGRAELSVYRRPRVAFFSTGDELRSIGEPLGEGDVYDSNRYSLYGMLRRDGVELRDLGVVRDDPQLTREALRDAAAGSDVVITSGGVSVGEADYIKDVLTELGQVDFWKIAMKPGRPLTFGRVGGAWFFGLPGNPVSVMVTYYQFVRPALRRLMGESDTTPLTLPARCTSPLYKRPGRTEFQRGVLSTGPDGTLEVSRTGAQGSGILRSMSLANCFILLPEDSAGAEAGETVTVQPFQGLI